MKIIPVLDLQRGLVVRGKGGRRHEYAPIRSQLTASALPIDVARAFFETFGSRDFYVADLDAIAGGEADWQAYESIAQTGARLHIDGGFHSAAQVTRLREFADERAWKLDPVIGSETLADLAFLSSLTHGARCVDCALSLDLRDGQPIVACSTWRGATPLQIATASAAAGIQRLIVLDLTHVGAARGTGTLALCQEIRCRFPRLTVWAGGGIAGMNDLEAMAAAGCDGALIASALHDGQLTAAEIRAAESWHS